MFELHHLSAQEQWEWLQRGDITPVELAEHYLARIERLNPELGAFTTVTADRALERAVQLQKEPGRASPLWGLPIGDKDLSRRAGVRTTFGSRLFENFVPDESDEIVDVIDRAGAVSLGKTNAPEFGLPSYTESLVAPSARAAAAAERPSRLRPDSCPSLPGRTAADRFASLRQRPGSLG
jgi:amidase